MEERKKFDKAFKEQVTRRIIEGTTTTTKMADELGVHYTTVRDWVRQYKRDGAGAFPGSGHLKPEDDERMRSGCQISRMWRRKRVGYTWQESWIYLVAGS